MSGDLQKNVSAVFDAQTNISKTADRFSNANIANPNTTNPTISIANMNINNSSNIESSNSTNLNSAKIANEDNANITTETSFPNARGKRFSCGSHTDPQSSTSRPKRIRTELVSRPDTGTNQPREMEIVQQNDGEPHEIVQQDDGGPHEIVQQKDGGPHEIVQQNDGGPHEEQNKKHEVQNLKCTNYKKIIGPNLPFEFIGGERSGNSETVGFEPPCRRCYFDQKVTHKFIPRTLCKCTRLAHQMAEQFIETCPVCIDKFYNINDEKICRCRCTTITSNKDSSVEKEWEGIE